MVPLGALSIYICLFWRTVEFYTIRSLSLVCLGKFVIYNSCAGVILKLHLNCICVCIDMFVNNITVSTLICLRLLYNIIKICTLSWIFFYLSLVHGLLYHCIIVTSAFELICLYILYLCLLKYVCVIYTIY